MFRILKSYLGEKYNKSIIDAADKKAPLKGMLSENGYCVISDYFDSENASKLELVSLSLEGSKESKDILRTHPFLCELLYDQKIVSIVTDYLGDDAVLDYSSGRRFLHSGPKSDTWHHDSVGHRIKIFLCLNDQDETTHTELIPKSHLIRYNSFAQNQIGDNISSYKDKILKVIGKKNDLIIFDTNLMHRGIYSQFPREIVQFEFSNIKKSRLNGHIGMRDCIFDKSVLKSTLIRPNKLKEEAEYVYYP
jgi:hypothetical protein